MAQVGYALLLLDLQPCEPVLALRAAGCDVEGFTGDIADEAFIALAVKVIMERWGRVNVLVNDAGIGFIAPAETIEAPAFRRVLPPSRELTPKSQNHGER
ncbi:SDR family NAD(P)-dependent oxidoreductase [Terriglobus roseus]|uniref:SDR family NAD(P)-dependent oxidoreductase n=1 Tax=Terriglobus roseus TaxID=392734 RepID=UPI0015618946|nr:SDR family NAD(P)-dependent oxidoreductase [Terriglobus roseus]